MTKESIHSINNQICTALNATAQVWDEKMGDEGNDFHYYLVRPAIESLLQLEQGQSLEEPAFSPEITAQNPGINWRRFSEIPPVIVARLRLL